MAIGTTISATAGKAAFKKVVTEMHSYIKTATQKKIKYWKTEQQIESLYKKIGNVRKVRTIWQVDKIVDLKSVYCDSHLVIDDKRLKIVSLGDFKTKNNLVIQGIAGQGKSIFLRHLCATELLMGNYIPVFFELAKIQPDKNLLDNIIDTLQDLGLKDADEEMFKFLCESGKILLLLDAFDEIASSVKNNVLSEIESLAKRYENIRIIITSRPNNQIEMSPFFQLVRLDDLHGDEYKNVIKKLASKSKLGDTLIKHVEKNKSGLKELLCTPLIVTLLILTYKSYQQLPNKLSDFYDKLFEVLLQKHDGIKPAFTRKRNCKLDDMQFRYAFETLCILIKELEKSSLSHAEIYEYSKRALELNNFDVNSEKFLDDIVRITCLIQRDGEEYRFIHKSVQEYFAASYVKRRPEKWVKNFYEKLILTSPYGWREEIEFLSEIDEYRYNKLFKLPLILSALKIKEASLKKSPRKVDAKFAIRFFSVHSIGVSSITTKMDRYGPLSLVESFEGSFTNYFKMIDLSKLVDYAESPDKYKNISLDFKKLIRHRYSDETPNKKTYFSYKFQMKDIILSGLLEKDVLSAFEKYINSLHAVAMDISNKIKDEESSKMLNDLF
jgi:hypothetical protein